MTGEAHCMSTDGATILVQLETVLRALLRLQREDFGGHVL